MMRDDIHPEELLVTRRILTAHETAILRAHLERCPGCAVQVSLRCDVARALVPTDLDYEVGARTVDRLLATSGRGVALTPVVRRMASQHRSAAARGIVLLVVFLGTGVAVAGVALGTRGLLWGVPSGAGERPAIPHLASRARATSPRLPSQALAPADVQPSSPATPPLPVGATVPAESPPRERIVEASPPLVAPRPLLAVRTPRTRPVIAIAPSVVAPPARETAPPSLGASALASAAGSSGDSSARIFAAAERARRQGSATEAERLYGVLATEWSGSREEVISRVLRGQILLDNLGHPLQALASFDLYLRDDPQGPLAEEARAGRAQAVWYLGRTSEEASAWQDLLTLYPHSLHAAFARSRLAALAKTGE